MPRKIQIIQKKLMRQLRTNCPRIKGPYNSLYQKKKRTYTTAEHLAKSSVVIALHVSNDQENLNLLNKS